MNPFHSLHIPFNSLPRFYHYPQGGNLNDHLSCQPEHVWLVGGSRNIWRTSMQSQEEDAHSPWTTPEGRIKPGSLDLWGSSRSTSATLTHCLQIPPPWFKRWRPLRSTAGNFILPNLRPGYHERLSLTAWKPTASVWKMAAGTQCSEGKKSHAMRVDIKMGNSWGAYGYRNIAFILFHIFRLHF